MSLPRRALGEGEEVEHDLHPHWKVLVLPTLALVALVGGASYAVFAMPSGRFHRPGQIVVLAVAVVLLVWWVLLPYLRWRTTNFVLTNRRIVVRRGVFSRTGRDVPLHRINDVSFSHSLFERMLGCGTLVVESAGERGQLTLNDVPRVEHVQREVYRLMEGDEARRQQLGEHGGPPEVDDT